MRPSQGVRILLQSMVSTWSIDKVVVLMGKGCLGLSHKFEVQLNRSLTIGQPDTEKKYADQDDGGAGDLEDADFISLGDFNLPLHSWVMIVSGVVCFWMCLTALLAFFCGPLAHVCHLCEQPVARKAWESGDHRRLCASEHERFLHHLPDASHLRCPRCWKRLKVWPPDLGPQLFTCQVGRVCSSQGRWRPDRGAQNLEVCLFRSSTKDRAAGGAKMGVQDVQVRRNGANRYSCFQCGFDACKDCCTPDSSKVSEEQQGCPGASSDHQANHHPQRPAGGSVRGVKVTTKAWINDSMAESS